MAHNKRWMLTVPVFLAAGAVTAGAAPRTAPPKHAASKPAVNQVKGQTQLAGADGRFGVVYTLKTKFNFEILSARYTLEPFNCYGPLRVKTAQKMMVMDIAIKNAAPDDHYFNPEGLFSVVDSDGPIYGHEGISLQSTGAKGFGPTLRPGQGMGQPALHNPLRVAFRVPEKARLVKIMINEDRAGKDEKVLRYYVAGATKAEAGENGDPKNVIAPLPAGVRDPADASGATALDPGKATTGVYVPSGFFDMRLDGFSYTSDPLVDNQPPRDGKKFAVAAFTAKALIDDRLTMFDVEGGDFPLYQVIDADGETTKPATYLKLKTNESAKREFQPGDEYSFRVVFVIPKDATVKSLIFGAGDSRRWAVDVSNAK